MNLASQRRSEGRLTVAVHRPGTTADSVPCLTKVTRDCNAAGVIRGAARQKLGVAVNLGAYWVFGIPLAVYLAFPAGWGVHGLWVGMAVTTTVQVGAPAEFRVQARAVLLVGSLCLHDVWITGMHDTISDAARQLAAPCDQVHAVVRALGQHDQSHYRAPS